MAFFICISAVSLFLYSCAFFFGEDKKYVYPDEIEGKWRRTDMVHTPQNTRWIPILALMGAPTVISLFIHIVKKSPKYTNPYVVSLVIFAAILLAAITVKIMFDGKLRHNDEKEYMISCMLGAIIIWDIFFLIIS